MIHVTRLEQLQMDVRISLMDTSVPAKMDSVGMTVK